MGDIFIFNSNNDAISEGEHNQGNEAVGKKQSVLGPRRKGLADITNLSPSHKVLDQDHVQQFRQEKAMLLKQLVERNKMIELCGIELNKLRASLLQFQQQNWQLAQANSQMLEQLNAGKDKLKLLGHELACRNNLLMVKNLELLNVKKNRQGRETCSKRTTPMEAGISSLADESNDTPCRIGRGQHVRARSQSPAKGCIVVEDPNNKRHQTRRQSLRIKYDIVEPTGNLLDTNDVKFPACPQTIDRKHEGYPMSDTSQEETMVSSPVDVSSSRPRITNARHPRKVKRGSIEKFESKRPCIRTRSSMHIYEEQENSNVDEKFALSTQNNGKKVEVCAVSLNTKLGVKKEADLDAAHEVKIIQEEKVTLLDDNPCHNDNGSSQQRVTKPYTAKGAMEVEKTEINRCCPRRQSSRLKCKIEEPNGCHPQNDADEKPENHCVPLFLPENTEKTADVEPPIIEGRISSTGAGRPSRRAAEKVQSYRELSLSAKLRRPD